MTPLFAFLHHLAAALMARGIGYAG